MHALINDYQTLGQRVKGGPTLHESATRRRLMEVRGILAELLSEMTISDARGLLFEKLRRTPVPSRTRIATSSSSSPEMTMSSSVYVSRRARPRSVVAERHRDARAHPRYRRLRRRRSIDRKTSSRRDGGARDEFVAFLSQISALLIFDGRRKGSRASRGRRRRRTGRPYVYFL